jgi:hypothetical protein
MKKYLLYLIVLVIAHFLVNILLSLFNLDGFSLAQPNLLHYVLDLVIWGASWGVSLIVVSTVRDVVREKRGTKEEKVEQGG